MHGEVPILGRRADLIGLRDDVVAVELKLRNWSEALRQAMAYQLGADRAWIAMPLARASTAYRHRWRLEAEGVGLLVVDDRGHVREPIPAAPSPRILPFLRDRLLAASSTAAGNADPFGLLTIDLRASAPAEEKPNADRRIVGPF